MKKRKSNLKGLENRELKSKIEKYSKLLKSVGLEPKKRLGQTFLVDDGVVVDQITAANLDKNDIVLEIGPGLGILTNKLAECARKVIAIEKDKKLYNYLKGEVPGNVELIHDDALALDFPEFDKLVSNIPYQISSPLIFKLLNYQFTLAIIMVQLEFANRLGAIPNTKDYSRLTVMTSYHYNVDLLNVVSKESFYPTPKVNSQIIRLIPKTLKRTAKNEQLFNTLIQVLFSERRKMIKNSILDQHFKFNIAKSELKEILSSLSNLDQRPEQLSLEQLIEFADELHLTLVRILY